MVLPIPSEVSHDQWIGKVADSLQLRLVVDDVLQFYRQHESNTSRPSHGHVVIKTRRQEILHHGLKDASDGWLRGARVTGHLSARLTDRASYLRDIGVSDSVVRKAVSEAETRRARLLERASLVSRPRWQRLYGVPRFALSGGYRSFRGWASAVKDILR